MNTIQTNIKYFFPAKSYNWVLFQSNMQNKEVFNSNFDTIANNKQSFIYKQDDINYFKIKYTKHTNFTINTDEFYIYTFQLFPGKYQPTGTINLSKIY